jgi:hypothetical protein
MKTALSSPLKKSHIAEDSNDVNPNENSSDVPRGYSTFSAFHKNIRSESALPPTPNDHKQQQIDSNAEYTTMNPTTIEEATQMEKEKKMHTFRKLKEIASPRIKSGALTLLAKRNNMQWQKPPPKDTDNLSFRKGWLKKIPSSRKDDCDNGLSDNFLTPNPAQQSDTDMDKSSLPGAEVNRGEVSSSASAGRSSPDSEPPLLSSKCSLNDGNESNDTFVSCSSFNELSDINTNTRSLAKVEMLLSIDTSRDRAPQTRR